GDLAARKFQLLLQRIEQCRRAFRHFPRYFDGIAKVLLRHAVGVVVVVDQGGVLVGPGDVVDAERAATAGIEMSDLQPDPRGLDQDFRAALGQKGAVPAGLDVEPDRKRDRGVYVILRRSAGVMRRALVAVDRAPRVERTALMVHLARMGAGPIERTQAP